MKYQSLSYSCGPAAIINALRCFGIKKTEKQILKISNTSNKIGTSEENMVNALTILGFHVIKHEQERLGKAWKWLCNQLSNGRPVIISINNWAHYVTAIGIIGDRIILFDPYGLGEIANENGVFVLNKKQLKKKWYHTNKRLYSGLAIDK